MERQQQSPAACSYHKEIHYYRFRLRVFTLSFLALIAVLFVVGCLIIQVFNSSSIFPKSYDLAEGDMRLITVSTTFCEGISLHALKLPRTLTVVDEVRTVKKARVSNVTLDIFIPPHKYWYKAFYLIKGSQIQVEANSESFFQLLIFKGKSNFDGWAAKQKLQHESKINKNDNNKRTRISYVYNVSQDENYYILFKRISVMPPVIGLSVSLSVSRRVFDMSNPVLRCDAAAGYSCEAKLLFHSKEQTIVEVLGSNEHLYINNLPSTWNCQPRIWFFLVVFGGGYIVCITCTLVIYILFMDTKARHLKSKLRKQSIKSQSSFNGSYREHGGSTRKQRGSLQMSSHTLPSRSSSRTGNQPKRPVSLANGSLKRKRETTLPSVIPHIYKGDSSDSDHEDDSESFHQLRRVPSMENISLASFDTTVSSPPATFSSFNRRLNVDFDSVSCNSFRHDVNNQRFRHRDRHHPRFYQELKLEREGLCVQAQPMRLTSHQSDSQLSRAWNMTLPARLRLTHDSGVGRDFYRDLEQVANADRERGSVRSARTRSVEDRKLLLGSTTKCDYFSRDFARKSDSLTRHCSDSQLDRRVQTLPFRGKRDFYRDLELARRRDTNYNVSYSRLTSDEDSCHGIDSDYELEFERAIERHENKRLISHNRVSDPKDFDQDSVGDQLDRIADAEDNRTRSSKPRCYDVNGCPPQLEPLLKATPVRDHDNHLVIIEAKALPDGKMSKGKKSTKDLNKKDIKLRNHSRHKERFWKPRLSIVSEV